MLAPAGTTWDPLILVVDEAQVAFMCPAVGDDKRPYGGTKATSRYFQAARKIHNQGRAVDVLLWQGTQDPTDQNLPKLVREGAHIRASLVLGTESQARMALGDKAIDGGAAPHKLRQGLDKGTVVVAGDGVKLAPGQSSITIRTHFIDTDAAAEIADRAKAMRSGVATRTTSGTDEPADHLADIAAVIGDTERMRTQEVLQRLAERNPGEYRDWTFQSLTAVLDAAGCPPYTSGGVRVVNRARVLAALDTRQAATDSE
jgi:S-DNA-T family DNA segregation ATPase FtsK/SpoIIIE